MKKLILTIIFLYTSFSLAQIINVPSDQPTIQSGINTAADGDTILVAEGTYFENINFRGKAITVASHFILDQDTSHVSKTIIDGSQPSNPDSGSVVYFASGEDTTSVLYGFTVTGGTGTPTFLGAPRLGRAGGGIFINNANAKICNNIIYNNTVADSFSVHGGGLAAFPPFSNHVVIIEDNIFNSNSCVNSTFASFGGGMQVTRKARISRNTFSNNIVSSYSGEAAGGGFAVTHTLDSVLIYNNTIVGNKVETNITLDSLRDAGIGGGFILWEDTTSYIRMTGNVIANNEASGTNYLAGVGGFIEDIKGDVKIKNNLFYGNTYSGTSDCRGSGLRLIRSQVNIWNNTITNNEPSIRGGALSTYDDSSSTLRNNIMWGNSDGLSKREIHIMTGSAPNIIYSDVQGGWAGEGNIDADPVFRDTLNGDFHLMSTDCGNAFNSPCIDAGDPSYVDTLFGCEWGLGTERCDMGAYSLIDLIVDVNDNSSKLPTEFNLSQNYPNPFNPATKIQYSIPVAALSSVEVQNVSLKVYDILGREVATLVNQIQKPGSFEVTWDASNKPSGIYFYKLTAGSFVETKKMILLR